MPAESVGVGVPDDGSLPFFAYGLLKPGELAHASIIGSDLKRSEPAVLLGASLRYRDGLPLLDEAVEGGRVRGELLWLDRGGDAYSRVGEFEPKRHYRWTRRAALVGADVEVEANVLAGRSPRKGSSGEDFESWTSAEDPVLTFGIRAVTELGFELALAKFPAMPGTSPDMWSRFFRLSAAYLLLWSAVERFTALTFGPALEPMKRVERLDEKQSFRDAVVSLGVQPGQKVVDSRNPETVYRIRDDGSGAAGFWYAVRSNLSHRGKSAFRDGRLLRRSLIDLHDVVKVMLSAELPQAPGEWPESELTGDLLREHAEPDT